MIPSIVLICMIECHIFDDYFLQGILASMKQKSWWEKQDGYSPKYQNDYIAALICHAFSWSFAIHFPILIYYNFHLDEITQILFFGFLIFHAVFHAVIDHHKANRKTLNLCQDQFLHLLQIILSYLFLVAFA